MSSSVSSRGISLVFYTQHQYLIYCSSWSVSVGSSKYEVAQRMSDRWFVRCNRKGVLPSQNRREMISSEVLFAVSCPSLLSY